MRLPALVVILSLCHCDGPSSGPSDAVTGTPDGSDTSVADGGPDADTPGDGTLEDGDAVADTAVEPDTQPAAGPDNPTVRCRSDADCGGGLVCCTLPLSYLSDCVTAAECSGGLHDACLTDEQCAARGPGEWSTCCHDRGNRNYCAPLVDTCQPLVPCETPADCTGNGTDVCCTPHPYYQASFCTSTFFAVPERDCP